MKTKHISIFLSLALLCACSGEDYDSPLQETGALEVTVSVGNFVTNGAPDTRATDTGNTTSFEEGDRMGIIVLDKSGRILSDNIPYKYSSNTWIFDSNSNEGKAVVNYNNKAFACLAYFPYSADANGITNIDGLKAQFQPQYDQRTKDAYRASDLLVWSTSGDAPLTKLEIALEHAYSSVSLPGVRITCTINNSETTYSSSLMSDVSFTLGGSPYSAYQAADGSYRIITVPQNLTASDRWFFTYVAKTYSGTMSATSLAAKSRYVLAPTLNIGAYTLAYAQVGDFYCKNSKDEGYLIPGDIATLTEDQQKACIGIVYSTDASRISTAAKTVLSGKGVSSPHGLVMALTNASEGCRWGNENNDENSGGGTGDPFKENTDQLQKQYNNVDGYGETHWIIDTYKNSGSTLKDTYTAFYDASRYGTSDSNTEKYAAPTNTTGWFIPGMGQWWDILSNLGRIDLTSFRVQTGGSTSISGAATTAVANMNTYLTKISDATQFSTGTYFWSSSEYDGYFACNVYFYSGGALSLNVDRKYYSGNKVRCSFAF